MRVKTALILDMSESREIIEQRLNTFRLANCSIVSVNGCFDLFHAGHAFFLSAAAEFGNRLVVGLNGDDSFEKVKGRRPIYNEIQRARVVASHRSVDLVVIYHDKTAARFIETIRPDVHCKDELTGLLDVELEALQKSGGYYQPIRHFDCKHTSQVLDEIMRGIYEQT